MHEFQLRVSSKADLASCNDLAYGLHPVADRHNGNCLSRNNANGKLKDTFCKRTHQLQQYEVWSAHDHMNNQLQQSLPGILQTLLKLSGLFRSENLTTCMHACTPA